MLQFDDEDQKFSHTSANSHQRERSKINSKNYRERKKGQL